MAEEVRTTIGKDQLVEALGISIQMIYRLSRSGALPEPDNGKWPWPEVNHAYIKYKSKKPDKDKNLTEQRIRREMIRAERDQLALDKEKGEVVRVDIALNAWAWVVQNMTTKLDAISTKAASLVHGLSIAESKDVLDKLVYEVKNEIANPDLKELQRAATSGRAGNRSAGTGKAKAPVKRKRVGGSKSGVKPRVKR